jgi:hypothetical protein
MQFMKKLMNITAALEQLDLLENLIERLADRHSDIGFGNAMVPSSGTAVESSSIETYVTGSVSLSDEHGEITIPFITCFIFTCTKEKNGVYEIAWSSSLS